MRMRKVTRLRRALNPSGMRPRRTVHEGLAMPWVLSFFVTHRCLLECRHCFNHAQSDDETDELSLDEYQKLSLHMGAFDLGLFCGGEPFIRNDLFEIVKVFQFNNGMRLPSICSNGQLTSSILRQTKQLVRNDPQRFVCLAISFEGFRDIHDSIRGTGTFDRALRTWKECQQLARFHPNLILAITSVINRENQDSLARFIRWAGHSLDPDIVNVLLIRQSPRGGEELKFVEPRHYKDAQRAARALLRRRSRLGRINPVVLGQRALARGVHKTIVTGERAFKCRSGQGGAVIDPTGNLDVCEVLAEALRQAEATNNLRDWDMDFLSVWNSDELFRLRDLVGRHGVCRACTHETMGYLPSLTRLPRRMISWTSRLR